MACQMNFTVKYPNEQTENYPESYWRVDVIATQKSNMGGNIVFRGYPSAALAGTREIGNKIYALSGAAWTAFMKAALSAITDATTPQPVLTLQDALYAQAYIYALSVLDTPGVDGNGNPIMVSAFSNAIKV